MIFPGILYHSNTNDINISLEDKEFSGTFGVTNALKDIPTHHTIEITSQHMTIF